MDKNITKFVHKHLELLLLEREENLQHFFNDLSPTTLHNLERSGQALSKLTITNLSNKGPDRFQIDLERADGLPIEHGLSSGDLVICIRSKEKGHNIKAIVIDVGESNLSISTNDQYENIEEDEIFTIVKTDSDFTYKTQTRALSHLEKQDIHSSCCLDIVKILFGSDKNEIHGLLTLENPIPKNCLDDTGNLKFSNTNLAEDQRLGVEFAIKRRYFAIVQGPPGTGKTTTLIEIIVQLYRMKKKVLICAPTNVAVDNLVVRLANTEAKPLRLGHPIRIAKDALKYSLDSYLERGDGFTVLRDIKKCIKDAEKSLDNKGVKSKDVKYTFKEVRQLKKEYKKRLTRITCDILRNQSVILCTLNSASGIDGQLQNVPKDHFDVLIIDEASQAMEASTWIAIPNAPKVILAGDINQLPPVIMCQEAVKGGLNVSLMERAIKDLKEDCYIRLTRQYRMNEKIMSWSSKKFYDNTLEADTSVKSHLLKDLPLIKSDDLTNEAVVFIDTCGCECEEFNTGVEAASKGNLGEAVVVDKVIANLLKAGVSQKDIGVITPYSLQVDFIRRSFVAKSLQVEVSTVDGFQGREKEIIILSLVRSNEDKELGFVTDFRRLNVAVTRARRLLIVIADSETMEKDELIVSLLKHIEDHGLLQTAEEYISENIDKEIEQMEQTSQSNVKPKSKSKGKNKSSKCEVTKKAIKQTPTTAPKEVNVQKAKEMIRIQNNIINMVREGMNLNNTMVNRKKFNVFDTIASSQRDDEETSNFEQDTEPADLEESASKIEKSKLEPKKSQEKPEEKDDFDKIVKEFQKSNSICSFEGCKKSTKLIKLICQFCKKWYCLEHGLQEIHGCSNEVRRKAQKDFRHRKPEATTTKEKDKFFKKLKELENARKSKKKSTK
ncbi:DNA-binding protein SMUBP-2-like [Phymastichus coffea]|uniref:DNA-binding protein SMUBP-2-like n=1 Tax=Phymastichus coffea TaxID=108790 RepID=UPI00273C62D6|nr:DNA-binding protein SMUBP-2-like [Phymastichus coffea]